MNIIAADVGGTKTRLILADAHEPLNVLFEKRYLSGEFDTGCCRCGNRTRCDLG